VRSEGNRLNVILTYLPSRQCKSRLSNVSVTDYYVKAGSICRQVKKDIEARNWEGKTYTELCDFVETSITNLGGKVAFPCNVCANESAAHYTAEIEDQKVVPHNCILKVDLGAHIDGCIADTAVTLCYNEELIDMAEATKGALTEALKVIKDGARTSDVGKVVQSYAARRGYIPISNLSGHMLDKYVIHAGTSVPNVWSPSFSSFKQGHFYAVEPFFTTSEGSGVVVEGSSENIFGLVARKNTKDQDLNHFLEVVWNDRKTLPFAARWYENEFPKKKLTEIIARLIKMKLVHGYAELVEAKAQPVAQAEHSVAVNAGGYSILT
jgi:methionyl aminopeptidase